MAENPAADRRRTYAEWYVWSARNLTPTIEIRHACAEAATEALASGGDPAGAARLASQSRSGPGWTSPATPAVRSYAEWYDWARTTLGASGEPLHAAAAAAVGAMEAGGDARAAESAARAAASGPAAPAPSIPAAAAPSIPAAAPGPGAIPPPPPPAMGWSPPAGMGAPPGPAPPPPPPADASGWRPPPEPAPPPPPAPPAGYPPPLAAPGPGLPPPPGAYGYPAGPYHQPAPRAAATVPVWASALLGIGCGISLLIAIVYLLVLTDRTDTPDVVLGSIIFSAIAILMFATSLVALVGIIRGAGWSRVMAIVAGAAFCLSCVGIVLGVPVIIGAATAGRAAQGA